MGCKKDGSRPTLSSEKTISGVVFKSSDNPGLSADIMGIVTLDSIKIEFPYGVSLNNLMPTINYVGKKITPASRIPQNFTNAVAYTVEAEDGTTRTYTFSSKLQTADTAALLIGRWNLTKDSISSINFYYSNGDIPLSGVLNGTAQDYYEFYSNQTLYISENHITGTSHYQFLPNNQIYFDGWNLMGNATTLMLTSTNASFSWSTTSPNGGRYYRKADLKR